MDDKTAQALKADTDLVIIDEAKDFDPNRPLGETGEGGVWETQAKTYEQERAEVKAANEAIKTKLRDGIKLTDKKYLPRAGTKLSKVAPRIFAAVRANPPDWLDEADAFISQTIGKCPSHTVRAQAANEWDAAAMAILLSFGYFAELLKEMDDANTQAVQAVEGSAGGDGPAPVAGGDSDSAGAAGDVEPVAAAEAVVEDVPVPEQPVPNMAPARSLILDAAGNHGDAFTILGPDGQPVIEKLR